jgi:threonine/homoserine/homoserine lactone efflux protein
VSDLLAAAGSGLAVLLELVEAFAIVLAVGMSRSWRDAWLGAAAAVLACAAVAAVLGPVLLERLGLQTLRLVIGAALLWFGFSWLRKNTLRLAGRKPRTSSQREFDKTADALQQAPATDWVAFVVAFSQPAPRDRTQVHRRRRACGRRSARGVRIVVIRHGPRVATLLGREFEAVSRTRRGRRGPRRRSRP